MFGINDLIIFQININSSNEYLTNKDVYYKSHGISATCDCLRALHLQYLPHGEGSTAC